VGRHEMRRDILNGLGASTLACVILGLAAFGAKAVSKSGARATQANRVLLAISTGPQLRLLNQAKLKTLSHQRSMLCQRVFDLNVLEIGYSCRRL